jgi:RNase H-like domain found in reverse transcriptase/Integrase zinc binding domain
LPNPRKDFEITTDASEEDMAIGAVLTQDGHPVAFESHKLNEHEKNYPVHDKEALAIMHALRTWRPFVIGRTTKVWTDHRSLVHLKTQPRLNQRQIRWLEELSEYDVEIGYKPGKENYVADALSRIEIEICESEFDPETLKQLQDATTEQFERTLKKIKEGTGSARRYQMHEELIYYRNDETQPWRLMVPDTAYRNQILLENHDIPTAGHPGHTAMYQRIARFYYWPGMGQDIKRHVQGCEYCQRTKADNRPPPRTPRTLRHSHKTLAINRDGFPWTTPTLKERE